MQTTDILRKHVSFYEFLGHRGCRRPILFSVLNDIRKGVYADLITKLRETVNNKRAYSQQKKQLPSVCFCGIFWGAHYKHNLTSYTNLLVIDIDHVRDNKLEIKRILIDDPKIVAVWDSVSGQGLKALLYLDYSVNVSLGNLWVAHEKCAFPQVQRYLKRTYEVEIDSSGKDVTRHCFVSFDPDIFLRKEFEPFKVDVDLSEAAMSKIRMRYLRHKYIRQNRKM